MSKLQHALQLACAGFHVFPLGVNSKLPLIKNYTEEATRDVEKIESWWTDPILEIEKDYNIGIATSKFFDNEALIAIDVDDKNGKNGSLELEKLDMLYEIPNTFIQRTPTGGRHLIYKTPVAVKQGTSVLAPRIRYPL